MAEDDITATLDIPAGYFPAVIVSGGSSGVPARSKPGAPSGGSRSGAPAGSAVPSPSEGETGVPAGGRTGV